MRELEEGGAPRRRDLHRAQVVRRLVRRRPDEVERQAVVRQPQQLNQIKFKCLNWCKASVSSLYLFQELVLRLI